MIVRRTITHSLRFAAEVKRYHPWPTLQTQTVGQHTEHVLRIYWQIWGDIPTDVVTEILFHDKAECLVGDPPHPIKLMNPELKAIYTKLEDQWLYEVMGHQRYHDHVNSVPPYENLRIKAADLLEMAEFAEVEVAMGNKLGEPIVVTIRTALDILAPQLNDLDRALVEEFYTNLRSELR